MSTEATAVKQKKKSGKKFSQFFKDLKSEVKKIVWPSKKQVKNNTAVVLAFMAMVGVFIWVLDWIFTTIIRLVFGA